MFIIIHISNKYHHLICFFFFFSKTFYCLNVTSYRTSKRYLAYLKKNKRICDHNTKVNKT